MYFQPYIISSRFLLTRTSSIFKLSDYTVADGRTSIPLKMEVDRSWFVVFSNDSNNFVEKATIENTPEYQVAQTIDTPWKINFESKNIAPETITTTELMDWSKSEDDLLKYYSGKANYTTKFTYQKSDVKAAAHSMINSLRSLAASAFKNSEVIGETVLAYAPVPGEQKGCVSIEEATGGRAWSLY